MYSNHNNFSVKCKKITKESEIETVTIIMKGKERDITLANQLRAGFMERYAHNEKSMQELIEALGEQTLDRLIHRLQLEKSIHLYRDYKALKEIALEVKMHSAHKVFDIISQVDDARVWINDNGKYGDMAFEALYTVFKESPKLLPYIQEKNIEKKETLQ